MRKHWIAFRYGDEPPRKAGFFAKSEKHARSQMRTHHAQSQDRRKPLHILVVSVDPQDVTDVLRGGHTPIQPSHNPLKSQLKSLEKQLFDLRDKEKVLNTDLSNFIVGSPEHDIRIRSLADVRARIKLRTTQIEILRTRL